MLSHGAVLRKNEIFSDEQIAAIARDFRNAGLPPEEVAMMAYAEKLTRDATQVTQADVDELRGHGFSDEQVLDITLAAAARNFYSKLLDALGAEPDAEFLDMPPELREALSLGRPFGEKAG